MFSRAIKKLVSCSFCLLAIFSCGKGGPLQNAQNQTVTTGDQHIVIGAISVTSRHPFPYSIEVNPCKAKQSTDSIALLVENDDVNITTIEILTSDNLWQHMDYNATIKSNTVSSWIPLTFKAVPVCLRKLLINAASANGNGFLRINTNLITNP